MTTIILMIIRSAKSSINGHDPDNHNYDDHQDYQDCHNDPGDIDHYTYDDQDCEFAQQ